MLEYKLESDLGKITNSSAGTMTQSRMQYPLFILDGKKGRNEYVMKWEEN